MSDQMEYLQFLAHGYDRDRILCDLMDKFGEDVWNFAFFITRRADVADDLSQEVFLAAYNSMYTFRGECSVKSWLLTITRNKSIHYLKGAFFRKVTLTNHFVSKDSSPPAEQVLFTRLENQKLWDTVIQLPRKYREVLILDYHYGLKHKEIAKLISVSVGTVKSRVHRAKKKMNELLALQNEEV
ncbi:RNA polymerase sigma factor [Paenibacillus sp. P36]|uniref:RNA polymerase sigma factor n=1 Tax=Paenibacillus sp. P36 TaxID=3342538 RepID=UPI0038B33568